MTHAILSAKNKELSLNILNEKQDCGTLFSSTNNGARETPHLEAQRGVGLQHNSQTSLPIPQGEATSVTQVESGGGFGEQRELWARKKSADRLFRTPCAQ